jgi:Tfp pilus assembly protein PilV
MLDSTRRHLDARVPKTSSSGYMMVEVVIAVVILAVGVLGLAGTTAFIARQVTLGEVMTDRAVALQTIVERIHATPFDSVDAGSDSMGAFMLTWSSVPETSQSRMVSIVTVGPGVESPASGRGRTLGSAVADTFSFRVIAR